VDIKIKGLIEEAIQQGVSAWIEYPDMEGFAVKVGYVGKEDLYKMSDAAKSTIWKKHRKEETVDRAKLTRRWAAKAILDWRGLTLGKLREFIPIRVKSEEMNTEVPCDEENRFTLLFNSMEFDAWLTEVATAPEYFVDEMKKAQSDLGELKK